MANKMRVSVEGLGDLQVKFGKMNLHMSFEAKRLTRNSTMKIQAGARKRARDQDVYDTGYLIRNILARTYDDGLAGEVYGGADYHVYNELGTRRMPARPMLYPAALEEKPKYLKDLSDALGRAARL